MQPLTKEQVQQYRNKFSIKTQPVEQKTQSFGDRVSNFARETGQDIAQTGGAIKDAFQSGQRRIQAAQEGRAQGEQNFARTYGQVLGETARTASNVAFEAGRGALKVAAPQQAEDVVGNAVTGATQSALNAGVQVPQVQKLMDRYERLKTENPALARDIEGALGLAEFGADLAGGSLLTDVGQAGVNIARKGVGVIDDAAKVGAKRLGEITTPVARPVKGALGKVVDTVTPKTPEEKVLRTIQKREKDFQAVIDAKKATREKIYRINEKFDGQEFDPIKALAQDDRFKPTVNSDGQVFTVDAIENLNTIANEEAGILRGLIEKEGKKVRLDVLKREALRNIDKYKDQGAVYNTYKNRIINDFDSYALFADENGLIPLEKIDDIKKAKYNIINYDNPENKIADRELASAARQIIEDNVSSTDVRLYNNELAKLYSMRDLLDGMNGARVKGGRLSKYFAGEVGSRAGALAGAMVGGPFGAVGGAALGDEVGQVLQGQILKSRNFNGSVGAGRVEPDVIQKARIQSSKSPERLQSPQTQSDTQITANINQPIDQTRVTTNPVRPNAPESLQSKNVLSNETNNVTNNKTSNITPKTSKSMGISKLPTVAEIKNRISKLDGTLEQRARKLEKQLVDNGLNPKLVEPFKDSKGNEVPLYKKLIDMAQTKKMPKGYEAYGAFAGFDYNEETGKVTFSPERAIVGILGTTAAKTAGSKLKIQALEKHIARLEKAALNTKNKTLQRNYQKAIDASKRLIDKLSK